MRIFHNPRCKKSREGLEALKLKTSNFEVVEYLKDGLTLEIIDEILLKTNLKPFDLVRTQEAFYKKELKGKNFTDQEWKEIIIENPKLLQRPIIIGKHKAILAQPANLVNLIIEH